MSTSNPYRTAGLRYHTWGANVNAICQRNDLKAAAHFWKQYQTERQTRNQVERLPWGGYTSKTGEQVIITGVAVINGIGDLRSLDLDKCPSFEPVATILECLHQPPDYPWVERTGSGNGWHIDVRCAGPIPPGVLTAKEREPGVYTAPSLAGDFDHIELRWEHCQTIKPPSQHKSGGAYRWHGAEPTEPPAEVGIEELLTAWHAVAQKAPPPQPKTVTRPRRERDASEAAEDEQVKDQIRRGFDLVAYASRNFTGEIEEIGDEVRVHDQGGLLIKPAADQWYCHLAGIGGDCFDLAGYKLHGAKWDRTDPKMFVEALQEAARFTGVSLPNRSNGGSAHDEAPAPDAPPPWLADGAEEVLTTPSTRPAAKTAPAARPVTEIIAELEALRPEGGEVDRAIVEAAAYADNLIADCAALSRAELGRVESTLQHTLGLPRETVRNWKAAVNEGKKRRAQDRPGGDQPDVIPYETDAGHIYKVAIVYTEAGPQIERTVVADFAAEISEEVAGEDGRRYYVLSGATAAGRPFEVEISAEKFADERALLATLDEAAGAYSPVRAKMAAHLRPAIKLLTRQAGRTRQTRRYDRTGWADGRFLIPGREPTDTSISLKEKAAYQIPADADLALGLAALDDLVQALDPTSTTVALTAIFQGPLAKPAGWADERFSTFVAGRTGSLKTSVMQCGMCVYGRFLADSTLLKWGEGATRNSIMNYATQAADLPLMLDNFKPNTGDGSKGFTNLVHNLSEGTDKDRMQRSRNELHDTRQIHCWPIFTGEDVPADDPATIARLLVVRFHWDAAGDNEYLTRTQAAAQHLPAVGGAWLSWLESAEGQRIAQAAGSQLVATRAAWMKALKTEEKDAVNAARIASNLAINQLTFWVLRQHPTIGPVLDRYAAEHKAGLEAIAIDMAKRSRVAREAVRFLRTLSELLATGRCTLDVKGQPKSSTLPDRMIGWRDSKDRSYYLLFDTAKRQVLQILGADGLGNLSDNAIHGQLAEMGLIASHDEGRHLKRVRVIPGERSAQWCLHLVEAAIGADLPDNEATSDLEEAADD